MNHLTPDEIKAANEYGESLRQLVDNQELPATPRSRASVGCLAIAQDHHHGIVVLLSSSLYASAFALVRPMFEAYVRGEWLSLCASEASVAEFLAGEEPPKFGDLVAALETTEGFESKNLSGIKKARWSALCSYTHSGGIHVQRWQTSQSIEPIYTREEVLEVLRFAEILLTLSVVGVLKQSMDEKAADATMFLFRARIAHDLDVEH